MANIALQGGKVILKDGKASCTCCTHSGCNEDFSISDQNVFEITKTEHDAYRNGGTWNVSVNWFETELVTSETPNCTSTGNDSGTFSGTTSGCNHFVFGDINGSATYTGPCFGDFTVNYSFGNSVQVLLKFENGKYYAKYVVYSNVSNSELTSSPSGYPQTVNFTVDGNALVAFGDWFPGWMYYSGYQNTSSITLNATFTPNT